MSKKPDEINDNEIRIISTYEPERCETKKRRALLWCILFIFVILILGCIIIFYTPTTHTVPDHDSNVGHAEPLAAEMDLPHSIDANEADIKGFTIALDTTINGNGLLILSPENARPRLVVGTEPLNNPAIVLATQATDVRGDNGQIAGTFVVGGELISKGEAKAGYCSIINGDLSIGIADATPMLEQTLTEGGYFFRQYPLVVGGHIVENKPKGKAKRKALAEIGGKIFVVISKDKLTFHDFSQLLIDAKVRNAIYLVGGTAYGFYVNELGEKTITGEPPSAEYENVNFIIWEQA